LEIFSKETFPKIETNIFSVLFSIFAGNENGKWAKHTALKLFVKMNFKEDYTLA